MLTICLMTYRALAVSTYPYSPCMSFSRNNFALWTDQTTRQKTLECLPGPKLAYDRAGPFQDVCALCKTPPQLHEEV